MLTNIYRIGGLHQVSWFQLVPDAERIPPTAYRKNSGFQDLAAIAVVMAHMRLQEEGHLSCWTIPAQKDGGLSRTIAAGISSFFFNLEMFIGFRCAFFAVNLFHCLRSALDFDFILCVLTIKWVSLQMTK
jgi:hypothetical protein